jgi:hypothetical protein
LIVQDKHVGGQADNRAGLNVTDLGDRFDTSAYLSPTSDIVALLVLEHQTEMHNLLTRANYLTRTALHDEAVIAKALGEPVSPDHSESTRSRVRYAGEPLVQYLLFSGEAPLTEKVEGTSTFARDFVRRGPADGQGRSLRDFDLEHRLFKYPCSYLIYSSAFDELPREVKDYVLRRLWDVLGGKDTSTPFAHLSFAERRAIAEILLATKPNLPDYWKLSP